MKKLSPIIIVAIIVAVFSVLVSVVSLLFLK
jgi:hypothetical protein